MKKMFEHSVKVPRHYKIAAKIFKTVSIDGGSVKNLLYDDKLKHFRTDVLYALITETIKHAADIDNIFEHCKLLDNEPRFDPWLAKVLTAELLFGKKSLPGKSKPENTIISYKEQFEKYVSDHQDDLKTEDSRRPRYVRINTNLLTTSDAIRAFQDEGYRFIRCTSGSYADYLEQIKNITEEEFTQDYHIKTIFVFAPGTKWHNHELYLSNQIVLQDKATALAVHLLAPPAGSCVLDMCAAPGMKTTQLAAYLRNNGKIYAVEQNTERYETLCDFVEKTDSKCVQTLNRDSLGIKRGEFEDVEYILLDPSCSGSGMAISVHNYETEQNRLDKLTSLQEKFLKHAMNSFPKAKRIVYSTCSVYPEENERVIANVVKMSRAKWRVQNVEDLLKNQWNNFGSAMYGSTGTRCLYARADSDMTTGFFLAVLDRDEKELAKVHKQEEAEARDVKKANKSKKGKADEEMTVVDGEDKMSEKNVKNKKKKDMNDESLVNYGKGAEIVDAQIDPKKKKGKESKKRKHDGEHVNTIIISLEDLNVDEQGTEATKKKKKKKDKYDSKEYVNNDNSAVNAHIDVEVVKSKKKKKRKHEDEKSMEIYCDREEIDVESSDIGSKITKKKKKNNHDIND